ncbi:hypothetical protein ACE3MQ_04020 [Paenibacillus lentus]
MWRKPEADADTAMMDGAPRLGRDLKNGALSRGETLARLRRWLRLASMAARHRSASRGLPGSIAHAAVRASPSPHRQHAR